MNKLKVSELLIPLQSKSCLTEEYAYNNQGNYPVIDGSTQDFEYKNKIDSYDYDCTCIAVTTVGFYAGHISKYTGKFSVGNNVQCYTVNEKYDLNIDYVIFKLFQITKNMLNGESGDYSSLNISKFESSELTIDSREVQEKIIHIMNKRNVLLALEQRLTQKISAIDALILDTVGFETFPISEILVLEGGSSNLTEEYIYNHSDDLDNLVKVYSGAIVFKESYINKNNATKIFRDTLKITRKGQAGAVTLIEGEFAMNDDAYAVKILPEFKDKINIFYLYFCLSALAKEVITSENGNGTFNKNEFMKLSISLPDINIQNQIGNLIKIYIKTKEILESLKSFRIFLNKNICNTN